MSDLTEKIIAAIQAEEDTVPPLYLEGRHVGPRTDAERALLRRCAADREIVEECRQVLAVHGSSGCRPQYLARYTLARLARGYGIQPEVDHA